MGLYLDFEIQNHLPAGCPGLVDFKQRNFGQPAFRWSGKGGVKGPTGCGKQQFALPEGAPSLSAIVEEYAEDQQAFIRDFIPALEKMLANGYDMHSDLTNSPDQPNVKCPEQDSRKPENRFWVCYSKHELSSHFMLRSKLDGRVVQEKNDQSGDLEMAQSDGHFPRTLRQVWQLTEHGAHWINAFTGKVKVADGVGSWSWSETRKNVLVGVTGKVLTRESAHSDGARVASWDHVGGLHQEWEMIGIHSSIAEALAR